MSDLFYQSWVGELGSSRSASPSHGPSQILFQVAAQGHWHKPHVSSFGSFLVVLGSSTANIARTPRICVDPCDLLSLLTGSNEIQGEATECSAYGLILWIVSFDESSYRDPSGGGCDRSWRREGAWQFLDSR
jgi:hypothetical protein